jgi:hypothetical protein
MAKFGGYDSGEVVKDPLERRRTGPRFQGSVGPTRAGDEVSHCQSLEHQMDHMPFIRYNEIHCLFTYRAGRDTIT